MIVRARILREDGTPAAGLGVTWRVLSSGSFVVNTKAVVGDDGALAFDPPNAPFGAHLAVGDVPFATAPVRYDGRAIDFGTLVAFAAPRGGVAGVPADALPPAAPEAKAATTTTTTPDATTPTDTREPVTLEATLVSAGQQIETAKTSLTTVSLAEVKVRWTDETAGATEVEATWREAAPTTTTTTTPAPVVAAPDLRGLGAAAAARKAAELGLRVYPRPHFTADAAQHGRVVRQAPGPGQPAAGGVVVIYVARVEGS